MVSATFLLMSVITRTPRKLKIAAMMIAGRGRMARVETQVAMAFGASVQPLTSMTASVRMLVRMSAGYWPIISK